MCAQGRTFFSLVAPQDMQNTLKAVSHLLSGEMRHVALSQNCLRKDGTSAAFSVIIRAGLAHMRQCNI